MYEGYSAEFSPQAKGSVVSGTSQTFFTGQHCSGRVQSSLVSHGVGPAGRDMGVAEVMRDGASYRAIDTTH